MKGRAVALAGVLAAAVAVGAELIVARFLPVGTQVFVEDAELLHKCKAPARRLLRLTQGGSALTEINELGFRGPLPSDPKSALRVAVYGDSLVLAENVDYSDTFVAQLSGFLKAELGRDVETICAGVSGYGPDQALLRFEREFESLRPDVLVFVLCAHNDFGDPVRNQLFTLRDGNLERRTPTLSDVLRSEFEHARLDAERFALARWADDVARRRRRLAMLADVRANPPHVDWYLMAAEDERRAALRDGDAVVHNLFLDYYDADVSLRPKSTSARHKKAMMSALFDRVRQSAGERGVSLFAVVVPSAADLDPDFAERIDPRLHPTWTPDTLTNAFATILAEARIPFADLYPVLSGPDSASNFVGGRDFHWNAKGQAASAQAVAAALRAELTGAQ